MIGDVFDIVLLAAVLIIAVVTVVAPRRAAAVAAFLVFGIVLAVLWARLDAPDIALAEAALGGGVAGALLVDVIDRPRMPRPANRVRRVPLILGALLGAAITAALFAVVRQIPDERSPIAEDVARGIPETGVEHPVTAVLLNYRSYDTLLEIAVLAVAAIGAVSLARRPIAAPGAASPVVRALALVLLPVLVLVAIWLLVAGTSRPGGAFQAGALLGAGLIIAHLAGLPWAGPRGRIGMTAVVVGLLAFVGVAGLTAAVIGGWLELPTEVAGTVILALETLLAVSIAAGLGITFLANRADEPIGEARA